MTSLRPVLNASFLIVALFLSCALFGQSEFFEGTFVYDMTYVDKTGEMSKKDAKKFMGDQQTWTISGGRYTSLMNGMMPIAVYWPGNDTLYMHIGGMESLWWINAKENPDQLVKWEIEENAEKIKGVMCNKMVIQAEKETQTIYYNPKIKLNAELYQNHNYGFWNLYTEKAGGLAYRMIIDDEESTIDIVLKEIKSTAIGDSAFELPDLPRVESPFK